MGQWTTLYLTPSGRADWTPTEDFVRDVIAHFDAHATDLWAEPAPSRWDDDERGYIFRLDNLSIDQAVDKWQAAGRDAVVYFLFDCPAWSDKVFNHFRGLPDADGWIRRYAPYSVDLVIGQRTIPDPWCERTAAEFSFAVELSGDGMPEDWDRYKGIVMDCPQIKALADFLERRSGMTWELLMSSSY